MQVRELQETLAEIQGVFEDAGARTAASDFEELLSLFNGHEDESVDEFLSALRKLYVRSPPARRPITDLDQAAVKRYAASLAEAGEDSDAVDVVLSELGNDKSVRKSEMNAIQKIYIGGRDAWPTRKAALEAIRSTFQRRQYQRAAMKEIEKVTPW